ncbi:uncharacterized protein LOC114814195 [Ornithorhynchus anatinus]|uniref:uncharacterized protein LOC114814195 n=1 Tax=Ornithorhynchus anatinus TaxID=9258 RepID=UPI0010A81456|nr:uncharacterized protein LOC114814195 [Ornithorhynchus anatinus]
MWDVLEALLFPIVAILWALQWPLSDEGFSLLFLMLLGWQVQRGHIVLWKKKDNPTDQSPAQTPANHDTSLLCQQHLKYQPEDASDKVWRLGQEHTKDPEEVLVHLKRHDVDMVSVKPDRAIFQHLSEEAQEVFLEGGAPSSVPQPPTADREKVIPSGLLFHPQDLESGTHHSQEIASHPNDCKSAQHAGSAGALTPTRDEEPQTPQLEKTHQQHGEPSFPPSALRMSEVPKEEAHRDTEKTFKSLQEPEASLVGTEPCCRPSLLCPKTRSLLEEHLKSMLHFQQSGTPNWVLEARSLLASQAGEPASPWRKGSAMTEDFLRIETLKSDKETPKGHQLRLGEIPSMVPSGQGDTIISSPRAPPASQGPSALPVPRGSSTATSPSQQPGQRFTSTLTLRLKPRSREDRRLQVKPRGLPESSIKSLESVLQRKYVDFLSGFCQLYDIAMSIAVSPAALPWVPVSTEVKPALGKDCSQRSVTNELKRGRSEKPKLSPIANCQETPLGSKLRRHSKVALDRDRRQSQPARALEQESQARQVSQQSKSSVCHPSAASYSGASTVIQKRKKVTRHGHSRAPVSAPAAAIQAPLSSCGPGASIPGPARASKGSQPPPKATFSEKLKMWFGSLGNRWQESISPRARVIFTFREPGKLSSATPEYTKLPFPKGVTHLRHGLSGPVTRRPRPTQSQLSYSEHLPRSRHRAP